MAGIYKYITMEFPEITECDKNIIAYNIELWGETATEILQFDAHEIWRKNQTIYNGDVLGTGTDSTELICKVTDKQGNIYIIPASKYEELKPAKQNENGTKNYYWRLYFDNLTFSGTSVKKHIGWRDFIRNYITEDNIYSIVLNGIANNQIQFSVPLQYNGTPSYNISYNGATPIQATKIVGTESAECFFTFNYQLPNNNLYNQIGNATQILSYFYYTEYQVPGVFIDSHSIVNDINNNGVHTLTLHTIFSDTAEYYNKISAFRVSLSFLAQKNNPIDEWWRLIEDEIQGVTILPPIISTPIITLPTTTQYNRGDIILPTNIAIVDTNTAEQNKVEYNTATIAYTLTSVTDDTNIISGSGVWSSKTDITDPEQGAMINNTINVNFNNVAIGEYVYKVVYTYSDGNIYTAEMTINVIALTLGYFGVSYTQMGYVLNRPISLQFSVTTGSTPGGFKPTFMQIKCTCVDTQLSMTRFLYVNSYRATPFVDFRPILPNYYNANKKTYTITIESILLNNTWQEYDVAVDTIDIIVNDASDKVAWSMWLYNGECNQMTTCILPQFLSPIQGYNTRLWLTFFANNQRLFKNTTLLYTTPINNWSSGYWHTEIFDFTDINVEDVLIVRGLWSLNDTLKPIIASEAERVMVKFIAPDDVEMPEFAMLLDGIYSEPKIVDSYITAQKTYPTIKSVYDVVEKMTLYIPMLTNRSIYYYHELFANQNTIKLSNGGEWCEYTLTNINVQAATEGYDNGIFTIELQKELTTKKYISGI